MYNMVKTQGNAIYFKRQDILKHQQELLKLAKHFFRYFSSYVCTFGLKQEAVWAKHRGFPGHAAARRLELSVSMKPRLQGSDLIKRSFLRKNSRDFDFAI